MTNPKVKRVVYIVLVAVVVGLGLWYALRHGKPAVQGPAEQAQVFVGGLVEIKPTTLRIKAADGTEKEIPYAKETRVISQVQKGEVGRNALQLGVGDVVSFVVGKDGVPKQGIELIPIVEEVRPQGSVVVSGEVVSKSATSIVVRPPEDPAMAIVKMNTDKTFTITSHTLLLTQVLGGETGKGDDALFAGVKVQVFGVASGNTLTADVIEIVRPNK